MARWWTWGRWTWGRQGASRCVYGHRDIDLWRLRLDHSPMVRATLPWMNFSPAPRSQVVLGNALVPATPLRPGASKASVRHPQAPSATPKGVNLSAQGWRSSAYPGFIEKKWPNPEGVESGLSRKRDATPSGLASLGAIPRVGAAAEPARQPWAELSQPFQGCPNRAWGPA
jgi:hypothetical protein